MAVFDSAGGGNSSPAACALYSQHLEGPDRLACKLLCRTLHVCDAELGQAALHCRCAAGEGGHTPERGSACEGPGGPVCGWQRP